MLESIYVGMTGLLGYSRGLHVIANNTANMNTPGFKGASLQFADLFYATGNLGGGAAEQNYSQLGFGLNTVGTTMSFKQGELRQTGNDLDMAIDGQGLFVLRGESGELSYTRAGQFQFDTDGVLVNRSTGAKVMGLDANGQLTQIGLAGQSTNGGRPTSQVKFSGNLSSTATEQTVTGVKVVDSAGGEHVLGLKFTNTSATAAGSWQVEVLDGATSVGTGQLLFKDGKPVAENATITVNYAPAGQSPLPVTLDFTTDVTSFAAGNLSTLAMRSQDGVGPGALTAATFDVRGTLTLAYANGQTTKGATLALARFDSPDAVGASGDNQFKIVDPRAWHLGTAGHEAFGTVRSGMIEISNVDLSREFSDLVVMQRGYQASSQIISTANDMLQELFSMKSR